MEIFNNTFAIIMLGISGLLIFGALFSKRVKSYNDELEQKKIETIPGYANQKNALKSYCPKCDKQLNRNERRSKKCEGCGVQIMFNPAFKKLFAAILVIWLIARTLVNIEAIQIALYILIFILSLVSLSKEVYVCKNI